MSADARVRIGNTLKAEISSAIEAVHQVSDLKLDQSKVMRLGTIVFVRAIAKCIQGKTIVSEGDLVDAILSRIK